MILVGTLGSMGAGATIPLMMLFFTNIIDNYTQAGLVNCNSNCSSFIPLLNQTNATTYDLYGEVRQNAIYLCSK